MEAALIIADMVTVLLVLMWLARNDGWGSELSGSGLFDYHAGWECEDSAKPATLYKPQR